MELKCTLENWERHVVHVNWMFNLLKKPSKGENSNSSKFLPYMSKQSYVEKNFNTSQVIASCPSQVQMEPGENKALS